ncbi:uncharacterized protein [Chironomus tepperi]|uniref:uncharacterized protein n=1 Tax=Chironomus tepperi TaxID=113505 RepID=UPI00391F8904
MCLKHPCYESLNKFAASKPARIIYGILLVIAVAFGCVRLLQASNDLHASKNAKLAIVPDIKANLIHFDPKDLGSIEGITSKIDEVYDTYQKHNRNLYNCDENSLPPAGKSCNVDWREFGPCNKENAYGYQKGTPCVFLKFKKHRDWVPNYLNTTNLPDSMPMELKSYIVNSPYPNQRALWVYCKGENPADVENIGPITYYPSRGFSHYYFPYEGQDGYLEPIIALYFERPMSRIILGILVIAIVALGCVAILQMSNNVQSKLEVIPNPEDNLISYSSTSNKEFEKYTLQIDQLLNKYRSKPVGNVYSCDDHSLPDQEDYVCDVDIRQWAPCVQENHYSYHRSSPCVFLKIKKTPFWEPKYVNTSDPPEKMPAFLKEYISNDYLKNNRAVWLSCEGENDVDKENIGPINYLPRLGFPYYYFPYKNQQGYLEPLIAIQFERPTRGVVIFVKCQIWTQDSNDSASFALYIQ